jgi:hypothetical protein
LPLIELSIVRGRHAPTAEIGASITAIILMAHISLATDSGWGAFHPAIVDTGAPVSFFPMSVWRSVRFRPLGKVRISGLSRKQECQIPAVLAEVSCALSDGRKSIGPVTMHAYLAETEMAPSLIGMLGFLEKGVLRVDVAGNRASLRLS